MFKKRPIQAETLEALLLFSVVIVLSIFSYFMIGATNRSQPKNMIHINGNESKIVEPKIEDKKLDEAIQELRMEGCQIVIVEPQIHIDNPNYVSYEEFKSKAIENELAIITSSESGTIMLVQTQEYQWIWIPS